MYMGEGRVGKGGASRQGGASHAGVARGRPRQAVAGRTKEGRWRRGTVSIARRREGLVSRKCKLGSRGRKLLKMRVEGILREDNDGRNLNIRSKIGGRGGNLAVHGPLAHSVVDNV